MGLLIHSHRHHFRLAGQADADLAALLSLVEGPAETYPCEWCGKPHARPFRGAYLCTGCSIDVVRAAGHEDPFDRSRHNGDDHEDEADRWGE